MKPDKDGWIWFKAPVKKQIHTNPDGNTIEISKMDIKKRQYFDNSTQQWADCQDKDEED